MRRARIKALAAVPVRKKPTQDSDFIDSDVNDVADKEKKEENISNINEIEPEIVKNIINVKGEKEGDATDVSGQREKDILSIDISEQEKQKKEEILNTDISELDAVEELNVTKIQEETTKKEQNKVRLRESVIVEKPDSQDLCSPSKSDSQELHVQTKLNSQESLCAKAKSDKVPDQSVQKSIPLPDVPTVIDTGKDYI